MMLLLVAIASAAYGLYFVLRARFSVNLAIVSQLALFAAGLLIFASRGELEWGIVGVFLGGIIAFWFGSFLPSLRDRGAKGQLRSDPKTRPCPERVIWAVVLVAGLLSSYHLIAGGIPLFSSSIERSRFDFTSSGLFGVPGRMFLFGVQLAWGAAGANATAKGMRWSDSVAWRVATAFLAITAVLSGFKGALLSTVILSASFYVIVTGVEIRLLSVIKRYWWAIVPPVAYFFAIATLYTTYAAKSAPLWQQLYERATIVAAEPAKLILGGDIATNNSSLGTDVSYFLTKYSGGDVSGIVPLERSVSASILGVNPYAADWAPPVTLTGFVEVTAFAGIPLALLAMFCAGRWLRYCGRPTNQSVAMLFFKLTTVLAIYNWCIKGGLVYYAINPAAVAAMLALVGAAAWLFPVRRRAPTAPVPSLASSALR